MYYVNYFKKNVYVNDNIMWYSESCLNRPGLGAAFVFGIARCSELGQISYIGTLLKLQVIQYSSLSKVQFIQDLSLSKVQLRQVSLY